MQFLGEPTVGLLNLVLGGVLLDPQRPVWIGSQPALLYDLSDRLV